MDIELRHLRAFVAVADELNFTRAAKRLFIAQQALSAQIQQLEQRIGTQLVVRTTRSVSLTPAGEVLFAQARLVLSGAEAAVAATQRASQHPRTSLTIGFVAAIDHADVAAAIERFSADRPDVEVLIHFGDLLDPTGGLRAGRVDVAFSYGPFDTTGLAASPLWAERMGVAMARHHRLATKPDVTVADVVAEPTFDFPTPDAAWRAFWSIAAFRGGAAPRYVAQFRTLEGLVSALRAGLGVHLATESLQASLGDDLVWRPLPEHPMLQRWVLRRADDDRPLPVEFVDAVLADLAPTNPTGTASASP